MNLKISVFILASTAAVLLSGCQNQPAKSEIDNSCTAPRPQLCTMNYLPVCATRKDQSMQTYANACGACSDEQVIDYIDGECP